jgi:hypothetical protein
MSDQGTIIGTSYGLDSTPRGTTVSFSGGHEVTLPLVQGDLAALSNNGILVTTPSPGTVNVYADSGQSEMTQIHSLQIDTASDGTGGISNPFNRVIGHNSAGDTKIIGVSTAPDTNGDWGYWDLLLGKFVDVSKGVPPYYTVVKLWAMSDTDIICGSVIYTQLGGGSRPVKANTDAAIPVVLTIATPPAGKASANISVSRRER